LTTPALHLSVPLESSHKLLATENSRTIADADSSRIVCRQRAASKGSLLLDCTTPYSNNNNNNNNKESLIGACFVIIPARPALPAMILEFEIDSFSQTTSRLQHPGFTQSCLEASLQATTPQPTRMGTTREQQKTNRATQADGSSGPSIV
jgi:hypothetical protein